MCGICLGNYKLPRKKTGNCRRYLSGRPIRRQLPQVKGQLVSISLKGQGREGDVRTGWGKDYCGDGKEGMEVREAGGKNPHICFFSSRLVVPSPNLTVPLLFY